MTRFLSLSAALALAAACSANTGADTSGAGGTAGGSGGASGSAGQGGSGWPDAAGGSSGAGGSGAIGAGGSAGSAGSGPAAGAGGSAGAPVSSCPGSEPPDCSPGPGDGLSCVKIEACFLKQVQAAVKFVIAQNPAWFDLTSGSPYVLEPESYMNAVVAEVGTKSVCCIRDPNAGDEIVVKHDNAFAENFDILSAEGYARYGDAIFTSTCTPAWF